MPTLPMGDIIRHQLERKGADSICLTFPDGSLSWAELERRANQTAHLLRELGVRQGDLVTLALPNETHFFAFTFGLWKLGATPHVVSPRLSEKELQEITDLADPRLVVGVEAGVLRNRRTLPGKPDLAGVPDATIPALVAEHWRAMSSGGSTGRPKVIVDKLRSEFDPDRVPPTLKHDQAVLNPGPLYHNTGFGTTHFGLFTGNHVVGLGRFDPEEALRMIERHRITHAVFVPTMMHRIWRLDEAVRNAFDVSSLELISHGAAPTPPWLKERWIEWFGPDRILEIYGGTEGIGETWITGREWLEHKGSVGRPMPGVKLRIINEHGQDCAPGEVGEIYFIPAKGPGSRYRYIGSQAKIAEGGYETLGDMGWLDEGGFLYLADRRTDLILVGGANVYPAEVEAAIAEHPGVASVAVVGLPDDDLGKRVHAIVQPHTEWRERLTEAGLREFLATRLLRYKAPRSYEFVDQPLRDDAGKVRRSQLSADRAAQPG